MADAYKFYLKHMNDQTGYRATWDPGRPLQIGFIGKLEGPGVFTVFSSLQKEGIEPEIVSDSSSSELDYTSNDQVSIGIKLAGSTPAAGSILTNAEAGFEFEFKSENAIVFKVDGYKTHQIINIANIESQIKEKYNNGNWEKDWVVVTQLIEADTATIIISNSGNSNLTLKAKAGAGTGELKLTDASLGLTVAREKGSTLKFITQSHLTPLYKVMGLVHPFLGKLKLATKSLEAATDADEFTIRDFSDAELADAETDTNLPD